MTFRLTADAQADIEDIYRYSYENFGERQADIYYDSLFDCFELLDVNPYLVPEFLRDSSWPAPL